MEGYSHYYNPSILIFLGNQRNLKGVPAIIIIIAPVIVVLVLPVQEQVQLLMREQRVGKLNGYYFVLSNNYSLLKK